MENNTSQKTVDHLKEYFTIFKVLKQNIKLIPHWQLRNLYSAKVSFETKSKTKTFFRHTKFGRIYYQIPIAQELLKEVLQEEEK